MTGVIGGKRLEEIVGTVRGKGDEYAVVIVYGGLPLEVE